MAVIPISTTGSYSQDFNTLVNTGTATWTSDSTISGWWSQRTGTGTSIVADAGTGTAGNLYSYGTGTNTDRALGSLGSGNAAAGSFAHGVQLQNTTGSSATITSISYVGEQWRNSAAGAQTITFWYQISPTLLTTVNAGTVNTGWTAVTSLDFTSPITGGTVGALDGNAAANRSLRSDSSLSISIPAGNFIMLRWSDTDQTGTDHGLAIDDFSVSFTAGAPAVAPTVTTPSSASVTPTTATLGGNITANGGATVTASGVVYAPTSTNSDPTIGGAGVVVVNTSPVAASGVFTVPVTGLTASTGYSFKAFATNSSGTSYSTVGTFSTSALAAPTVASPTSTSITQSTATLGGHVTADGGSAVTVRGIVYAPTSTNSNPQLGGAGVIDVPVSGTTGVFTTGVSGLAAATGYSFAAYATNGVGTTYSSVATFSTVAAPVAPTVTSPTSASVTSTTATLGGNVTSDGGSAVTERGVLVALTSVNSSPTLGGTGVTGFTTTGTTGVFTASVTGLTSGGAYSFVAYATNAEGTSYSSVATFTTQSAPIVATPTAPLVADIFAQLSGNITGTGGPNLTARGFVISATTVNNNPIIGGTGVTNITVASPVTGTYGANALNLSPGTSYSFASYATNSIGTTYSSVVTFTTAATTTLAPGDLVFTGYNGTTTTERVSFVALVPISVGTTLSVTDNGYGASAFNTNEGNATVYFSQAFAAGSRFYYEINTNTFYNFDGSTTGLLSVGTALALSNSGDQATMYQGTLASPSGFVAQISAGAFISTSTPNTNNTYLAPGLTVGTNALTLGATGNNGVLNSSDPEIGTTVTGTPALIRSLTQDVANWSNSTLTTFVVPPAIAFVVQTLATPTVTISSGNLTYSGSVYAATASVSGFNAPDPTSSLSFTYYSDAGGTTTISAPTNAGTYYVRAFTSANAGNSAAQSAITAFTINQAPLTITADAKSKTVGAGDPTLTYTTSAFVNGETAGTALSGSLTRTPGETVGTYPILQGSLAAVNGNYAITYIGADLTINPAAVAPTFVGAAVNGADTFLTPSQRSQVTSIVLTFSAAVNIASDAFSVSNIGLVTAQAPAALASSQILVTGSGTSTITLRWGVGPGVISRLGSGTLGNSLADGNWVLNIDSAKVTAVAGGSPLTGDASFGDVPADNFFRLFGDSNGDGLLTSTDTAAFRAAFSTGTPFTGNAAFDWDGDGVVSNATNSPDRMNFLANSGKRRRTNFGNL